MRLVVLLHVLLCLPLTSYALIPLSELLPCSQSTLELTQLGESDELQPCIVFDESPSISNITSTSLIPLVQVTPSDCGNHRDGTLTGVRAVNEAGGMKIGFHQDHTVLFRFVSVVGGNPRHLGDDEYRKRHELLLNTLVRDLQAPYIVGTCPFAASVEKEVAYATQAILVAQVGPPSFYEPPNSNPYVFGLHLNSDTYAYANVQALDFAFSNESEIPVRVVTRQASESNAFFYSTCRSAVEALRERGFTNVQLHPFDPTADDDGDGIPNEFDSDFLHQLADQACPPDHPVRFRPALFVCTHTEQDALLERWRQNRCQPTSLWMTAATQAWADQRNPEFTPYIQGGAQWHAAMDYADPYYESGSQVLNHNAQLFGYNGTYDQVVSYAIPVLFAQHLKAAYRVTNNPTPLQDFDTAVGKEVLRRDMMVLTVDTLFGRVAFDPNQRNIGRQVAATQWLPYEQDEFRRYATDDPSSVIQNALVAPMAQAQATIVLPSPSAEGCGEGHLVNRTAQSTAILQSSCDECPVDTYSNSTQDNDRCDACPEGFSTRGQTGQTECIPDENFNYISETLIKAGYALFALVTLLACVAGGWLWYYKLNVLVRMSQPLLLGILILGCWVSSFAILPMGVQAGYPHEDPDIDRVDASCMAAPWLWGMGFAMIVSPLMGKLWRIKLLQKAQVTTGTTGERRRAVGHKDVILVVGVVLLIEFSILMAWQIVAPSEWVREERATIDGFVVESAGGCKSENNLEYAFLGALIGFQALCLLVALLLSYRTRNIHSDFAESGCISLAVAFMFQVVLLATPIMALSKDNNDVYYVVRVGSVFLQNFTVLLLLFAPKMRRVQATIKKSGATMFDKKKKKILSVASLTNSKWDEAVDIINRMLDEDSDIGAAMSDEQRQELETVKATLLTRDTGKEKDKLLHVPKGLIKLMPSGSGSSGSLMNRGTPKRRGIKASDTYILKEFAGVDLMKRQEATRDLVSERDLTECECDTDDLNYIPPEFERLSKEAKCAVAKMLSWSSLKRWDFNIFDLLEVSGGNPLLLVGWAVMASPHSQLAMEKSSGHHCPLNQFEGYHFINSELKIPHHVLCNYLRAIEKDYVSENPYHNAIHAADVVQTLHALLQMAGDSLRSTNLERFSILLAAVVHDVKHPGENNAFQTNARTDLSLVYNDSSTLENKHASHAFVKMFSDHEGTRRTSYVNIGCRTEFNVLCNVDQTQLLAVRNKVIRAVLHTDMSLHFKTVNEIKAVSERRGFLSDNEYRWDVMMFMLHLADISNPAKPTNVSTKWTDRCLDEFFAQGDKEEKLGIPISPNCDRRTTKKPDSQIGFINFVIKPGYEVLAGIIPEVERSILPIIIGNAQYWENKKKEETREEFNESQSDTSNV